MACLKRKCESECVRQAQFPFTMSLMFQSRGWKKSSPSLPLWWFSHPQLPFFSQSEQGLMLFCNAVMRMGEEENACSLFLGCMCGAGVWCV